MVTVTISQGWLQAAPVPSPSCRDWLRPEGPFRLEIRKDTGAADLHAGVLTYARVPGPSQ